MNDIGLKILLVTGGFLVVGSIFGALGAAASPSGNPANNTNSLGAVNCGAVAGLKGADVSAAARKDSAQPPKALIPIYQAAAAQYSLGPMGPNVLAAINRIETAFGHNLSV